MGSPTGINSHPYLPSRDPERRWLFRLEFSLPAAIASVSQILTINAQAVSVPAYEIPAIIIPHLNVDAKVAGRPTLGNMTVSFLTGYNTDAVDVLERWHNLIYAPDTEVLGFKRNYLGHCNLVVLQGSQDWKIYDIQGVWPSVIGNRDYDWSASEHVVRQVVFEVDKVLPPTISSSAGGSSTGFSLSTPLGSVSASSSGVNIQTPIGGVGVGF